MLMFTRSLRLATYAAIGTMTLSFGTSAMAQGCRGGNIAGGPMGGSMGGGYIGGGPMSGYLGSGFMGGGYMGGMGSSGGMSGYYGGQGYYAGPGYYGGQGYNLGQGQNNPLLFNSAATQPAATNSSATSVNNPSTVLARADDLSLTSKQRQLLEKMEKAGKQHAALVLTKIQRKQLAEILGATRKTSSI